ncbi:MAG: DivIVA domain-containing protein [Longimicrobiales bacterium]
MIDLTPLEVRKKKGDFRKIMRGYDPGQVDDFLDLVADRLEQLVRDNIANAERVIVIEAQVSDFRERERALTEALVTAQEMREEIRKQVAKEAELARREAEQAAEHIRSTAVLVRQREEEAIRRLRARQMQLLQSYRSFLERELAELGVMAETLEVNRSRPVIPDAPTGERAAAPPVAPATAPPAAETRNPPADANAPHPPKEGDSDAWLSTLIENKS